MLLFETVQTMIEKLQRTLEKLQNRDISKLGYEAQIRHQQKIDELKQRFEDALEELATGDSTKTKPVAPTV